MSLPYLITIDSLSLSLWQNILPAAAGQTSQAPVTHWMSVWSFSDDEFLFILSLSEGKWQKKDITGKRKKRKSRQTLLPSKWYYMLYSYSTFTGHWPSSDLLTEPCLFSGRRIHGKWRGQTFTVQPLLSCWRPLRWSNLSDSTLTKQREQPENHYFDYCCYFTPLLFEAWMINVWLQSVNTK